MLRPKTPILKFGRWVLANSASQNSQDQTPAFDFNSGGFFAAYDYGNTDQGCIGALAGYAHSSIHEHQSMGNSHLNAGYLSIYGTRSFSDFFIDAAIWGEYMSVDQKRIISFPGFRRDCKKLLPCRTTRSPFWHGIRFQYQYRNHRTLWCY